MLIIGILIGALIGVITIFAILNWAVSRFPWI